jgi:pimeloyl-ACP methyl ester carboxylesterase
MRNIHIALLCCLFFTFLPVDAQSVTPPDQYAAGREIIADLQRIVNPAGVQENYPVKLGGIDQWVYVRGQNRENPIILFVHGGPASPMAPLSWMFQRPIEEYFTVVNWDQRAAGKTLLAADESAVAATLRIDRYADDAVELADYLTKRYGKKKVILVGHSWGTVVGLKAALKRPDLFDAYVGIGQVISMMENERLSYEYALQQTEKHGNAAATQELKSIYPYPGDAPVTRERIIIARKWAQFYGGLSAYRSDSKFYFYAPFLSPEYDAASVEAIDRGNVVTLGRILPEFLQVDFRSVKRFPIPVVMLMGRHDYSTPSVPTAAWLEAVKAPYKRGVWFENSSHLLPFEEPGKMLLTLVNDVRPLALKKERPARK